MISIIAVNCIINLQAQTAPSGNTTYVKYSTFNKDTLNYLKTNFEINKSFYIGKPLNTLLGDLELPVLYSTFIHHLPTKVEGVSLSLISGASELDISQSKGKVVNILITFSQPIPMTEIDALINQLRTTYANTNIPDWDNLQKAFYGNRIIGDIQVVLYDYSKP
jgi:hypothetical protein